MAQITVKKSVAVICLVGAIICTGFGAYYVAFGDINAAKTAGILFPVAVFLLVIFALLRK